MTPFATDKLVAMLCAMSSKQEKWTLLELQQVWTEIYKHYCHCLWTESLTLWLLLPLKLQRMCSGYFHHFASHAQKGILFLFSASQQVHGRY